MSNTGCNNHNFLNRLRILMILPFYGGSLPVGQNCIHALRELGHTVEVFEGPQFNTAFNALKGLRIDISRLEYLENSFLNLISQAILAKVESFEPDLVLAVAQAPLTRQALKRLRKDNVPTAMWFVEDFKLFTYWRAFAPFYDFFAIIQKGEFEQQLAAIGVQNSLYLPLAARPDLHCPMQLSSVEQRRFGSDVSFLGAGYPNRRRAFKQLTHLDLRIWGTEWDGEIELAPFVQRGGARIEPEEVVKIFNASKINLNLHSSVQKDVLIGNGDFVNPRTFELACCQAFQLVDERSLLSELFADDELATFNSMPELLEKIDYFLTHSEEREQLSSRSRKRVLSEHTYTMRMQTLLNFISEKLTDWPHSSKENSWPDLPLDLQDDLQKLLEKLELPASVSFEDLLWTLRQRSGSMTPLETSLLFLDEWKKQYGKQ